MFIESVGQGFVTKINMDFLEIGPESFSGLIWVRVKIMLRNNNKVYDWRRPYIGPECLGEFGVLGVHMFWECISYHEIEAFVTS